MSRPVFSTALPVITENGEAPRSAYVLSAPVSAASSDKAEGSVIGTHSTEWCDTVHSPGSIRATSLGTYSLFSASALGSTLHGDKDGPGTVADICKHAAAYVGNLIPDHALHADASRSTMPPSCRPHLGRPTIGADDWEAPDYGVTADRRSRPVNGDRVTSVIDAVQTSRDHRDW